MSLITGTCTYICANSYISYLYQHIDLLPSIHIYSVHIHDPSLINVVQ